MENSDKEQKREDIAAQPVEHDYNKHKTDPGPSKEAVTEDSNKGAGLAMKWLIPILIVILFICYLIFRE